MNYKLFKHPGMRDVALEVWSHELLADDMIRLHVYWYNIGLCHAPWYMGIDQHLTIPVEKWLEFEELPSEWKHAGHEYPLGEFDSSSNR